MPQEWCNTSRAVAALMSSRKVYSWRRPGWRTRVAHTAHATVCRKYTAILSMWLELTLSCNEPAGCLPKGRQAHSQGGTGAVANMAAGRQLLGRCVRMPTDGSRRRTAGECCHPVPCL